MDKHQRSLTFWSQIFWLLPPFALFSLSFGGIIVPKLNLILGLVCEEYFSERSRKDATFHMTPVMPGGENPQCRIPEVQALVSKFTLYANLITGLLAAVTSPKLGELSDRYGRVPMMSLTTLGLLVSELITILVATCPDTFSVNWILLGYFFDGIGGSFIAAMALSYAYASDCTAPDKRNVVFGYYHGCLFGGIALGPIFAGYIVKLTGDILTVFYIAIASHCAFFLFLMFVVPESLTKARQRAAREKRVAANKDRQRLNVWRASDLKIAISFLLQGGGLLAPLKVLWPTGPGTNPAVRRNLFCLAAVDMIMFGVAMGSMTVVLIYSEFIFGWDNFQTSLFVSIVNIGRVTVLLLVLPALSRLVRGPQSKREQRISGSDTFEIYIIRVAIFFDLLGYLGYATVRTGPLFILSGLIASFGGMGSPTLQAALTKHVPPEQTGQVLGAVGLLHASARVVAPTVFNLIYAETVGKFTQTVFVCLGATFGVAFIISWFIRPHGMPQPKRTFFWRENSDILTQTNSVLGPATARCRWRRSSVHPGPPRIA